MIEKMDNQSYSENQITLRQEDGFTVLLDTYFITNQVK